VDEVSDFPCKVNRYEGQDYKQAVDGCTMPIKFIGRTTDFKGKPLWEILGNLRNHGVGRIVIRNRLQRYPEPSYMKILKVAALPPPEPSKYEVSGSVSVAS